VGVASAAIWLVKSAGRWLTARQRKLAQPRAATFVLGPVAEREVQHPASLRLVTLVILGAGRVAAAFDEPEVPGGVALCLLAVETPELRAAARQHLHHCPLNLWPVSAHGVIIYRAGTGGRSWCRTRACWRGRWALMLRTGWVVVRRTVLVSSPARSVVMVSAATWTVTTYLHQALVCVLAATTGIMAVVLLASRGGPLVSPGMRLYAVFGYNLLLISAVLAVRVLFVQARWRRGPKGGSGWRRADR
jgi:hypothetical protein